MNKPKRTVLVIGASVCSDTRLLLEMLAMQSGVEVLDELAVQDYAELELRVLVSCGSPSGNVGKLPKCHEQFEGLSNKFNQKPEKSTFTPKINRATKRW